MLKRIIWSSLRRHLGHGVTAMKRLLICLTILLLWPASGFGANTFGTFTIEPSVNGYGVQFPAGVTTAVSSLVADGTVANRIKITSSSAATHTLSDTSGTNAVKYYTISYSTAQGGATWTDTSGVNGGNNSGWVFKNHVSFGPFR